MNPQDSNATDLNPRRTFLFGTAAAAAAAGLNLVMPSAAKAVSPALTFDDIPGTGDVKVLNYALALEAIEADLYVQCYQRLTYGGTNAAGTTIPGLGLGQREPDVIYVKEFANVEKQHRDFINGGLGSASILASAPFSTATFSFNVESMSRLQILTFLHTVEATGTRAYLGAIPFLATKTYLQTAAAIQGTEARHTATMAGLLNYLFGAGINPAPLADDNGGRELTLSPNIVLRNVSPYINLAT